MDLSSSLGFLILLVVMSGGIAYLADKVAKKIGKKRISLLGLRPRHTAEIITILVGILISIFTIAFILAVASPVRRWLFEGSKIRQQIVDLNAERTDAENKNKRLQKTNGALENGNGTLVNENKKITKQLADGKRSVADEQAKLKNAQAKLANLQSRYAALQTSITNFQARIKQQDASIKNGTENLRVLTAKKDKADSDLQTIKRNSNEVINRNIDLTARNETLVADIKRSEEQLKQMKADVAKLQTEMDKAQAELDDSTTKLRDARMELDSVQAQLKEKNQELQDVEVKGEKLIGINDVARHNQMMYRFGEEVARLPVHAGLSINAATEELTTLLRRARVAAQQHGAKPHGKYAEAGIFAHSDEITQAPISTEMIEREIIRKLAGSTQGQVLIAVSSLNAFRGEAVSLEVSVLPNPLVYSSGQLIAESVIDANKGDAVIWQELQAFFQGKLKQQALKDGMIPIANSDIAFGQLSGPDIIQVVEQLNRTDRAIRLQAHAAGDTHAADTLKLDFRQR